jgi:hypothetical protein
MSYEDTSCPCGGKKERETMLCNDCEQYLADHPAMKVFRDKSDSAESRRHAATILLTVARKRKANFARGQGVTTRRDQPRMPTRAGGDAVIAGVANSPNAKLSDPAHRRLSKPEILWHKPKRKSRVR